MNTHTAVEVFLGKPIEVSSERQFLARLQRDLQTLGVSARILANLHVGRYGESQIDFVVITAQRTMLIELKTFSGPIVSGPHNGAWRIRVGAGTVEERRNPLEQARTESQHFSDELHRFAKLAQVPPPTGRKFWSDVEAVACAFPDVPGDSTWEPFRHAELIDYQALVDRLQKAGRSVRWSPADWDRFVQHLNLYRADEDVPENVLRAHGGAAIDSYAGLYREANADVGPIANTPVAVDSVSTARPDLADMLARGAAVLLHGESGTGKTLWARAVAVELAEAGHLPVWIEADMCDGAFLMSCAQAVAPYTALSINELIKAADADGRAVVFIVDDFSKISTQAQRRLLDGLRTTRVRACGRGLLLTDQQSHNAAAVGSHTDIEVMLPDDESRREVLAAYGQADLGDRCEAFVTPLELSLAAQCADDLGPELSRAELFDTYIDKLVLGDPETREALRAVAAKMATELRPFQRRGEVARMLRRDRKTSDEVLRRVFECPVIADAHGRLAFRHEQFERFLAAEALSLDESDPAAISRLLNAPSASLLRSDVIALEGDRDRLKKLLSLIEDATVLVHAANGRLGTLAAEVVRGVFVDALNDATTRTTGPGNTVQLAGRLFGQCEWTVRDPMTAAEITQLSAIGRLISEGTWVSGVDTLLRHTDELCAAVIREADPDPKDAEVWSSQVFAATYVFAQSAKLPATALVGAATDHFWAPRLDPEKIEAVVDRLLPDGEEAGLGALYIAAHLLRLPDVPLRADVIASCVLSEPFHLRSAGLHLAQDRSGRLRGEDHDAIIQQLEAFETNNLALNTALIEALAALGGVEPVKNEDDIAAEIAETLLMKGHPEAEKLAYGIVSSQFENEIVGPYYQVISALPTEQRLELLAMALNGGEHAFVTDCFILDEIEDLSSPEARDAVNRYVARINPREVMSVQHAMQGTIRAMILLAQDSLPIPPAASGDRDPVWQSAMELTYAAAGDDDQVLATAWAAFAADHPEAVASFLGQIRGVRRIHHADNALLDRLESVTPNAAVNALVNSLEHPERVHSIGRYEFDLRRNIVLTLGKFGGRQAAEALRRFVDDPEIGEAATAAVRTIEGRVR
jgi:Nuclease-related domain/ATPase family associated with various cellular activities (AAA)